MHPDSIKSVEVYPFNQDNLAKALSNEFITPERIPEVKRTHFPYFLSYLGPTGLGACTIVVEYPYISKAYLNDFASYYSLCFDSYSKYSKRIHFFKTTFSKRTFNTAILNEESSANKIFSEENYLGHIVAKPLPEAIIGSTLLKTYDTNSSRVYTTKKYHINIFGKKLSYQSLVYQEQDTIVSACATTAIWSVLHKAFSLFQTPIPNPNEITSSAGNLFLSTGRSFPNHGLDLHQIGNAIHSVGLVFELRDTNSVNISKIPNFKSFLYAYLKIGIPVLLGIELPYGLHLIAITGYCKPTSIPTGNAEWPGLRSEMIEKIYAHDDQTGPFAKMTFDELRPNEDKLITSWIDESGNNVNAKIVNAIIPLHPKIRINYEEVYTQVRNINKVFSFIFPHESKLTWDIYLEFGNVYKSSIRAKTIDKPLKKNILFSPYPKHIWVASMYYDDQLIFEFIFDATGIARSFFCLSINCFHVSHQKTFKSIFSLTNVRDVVGERMGHEYIALFDKALSEK